MPDIARWLWRGEDVREYLSGQISSPVPSHGGRFALVLEPQGRVISWLWVEVFGDDVIVSAPAELSAAVEARLRRFRIRVRASDEPIVGEQWAESRLLSVSAPSSEVLRRDIFPSGLERRFFEKSVVLNRGCYPGQEMVERADSRGTVAPWVHRHGTGVASDIEQWLAQYDGSEVANVFSTGEVYVVTKRSVDLTTCPSWTTAG
jgi:folate-binding Fe-S cluster repair protein YgfZ